MKLSLLRTGETSISGDEVLERFKAVIDRGGELMVGEGVERMLSVRRTVRDQLSRRIDEQLDELPPFIPNR